MRVTEEFAVVTNRSQVHPAVGRYCIIRSYAAGVHVGIVVSVTDSASGREVELCDTRRIWSWQGALSCTEIAVSGISGQDELSGKAIGSINASRSFPRRRRRGMLGDSNRCGYGDWRRRLASLRRRLRPGSERRCCRRSDTARLRADGEAAPELSATAPATARLRRRRRLRAAPAPAPATATARCGSGTAPAPATATVTATATAAGSGAGSG